MQLNYKAEIPESRAPIVLRNENGRRIELCVSQDRPESFTLTGLSGNDGHKPEKSMQQGPFYAQEQIIAARGHR